VSTKAEPHYPAENQKELLHYISVVICIYLHILKEACKFSTYLFCIIC